MVAFGTIEDIVATRPELAGRSLEELFIALTGDEPATDITAS
jgi:ABC-2 type transport system ATP-binding protein